MQKVLQLRADIFCDFPPVELVRGLQTVRLGVRTSVLRFARAARSYPLSYSRRPEIAGMINSLLHQRSAD